jgi:hypothetical protein
MRTMRAMRAAHFSTPRLQEVAGAALVVVGVALHESRSVD